MPQNSMGAFNQTNATKETNQEALKDQNVHWINVEKNNE